MSFTICVWIFILFERMKQIKCSTVNSAKQNYELQYIKKRKNSRWVEICASTQWTLRYVKKDWILSLVLCAVCEVNGMHVLHIICYLIECGRERITEDLFTCLYKEWLFFFRPHTPGWKLDISTMFLKTLEIYQMKKREFNFTFCFIH